MTRTPRRTLALFAVFIVAAALCGLAPAGAAPQAGVEHVDSRESFAAAASGLTTIDFGGVAPARGFGKYRPEEGLSAGGATFRARGGARFGPGLIYVISEHYGGGNPLHNTGMLPHLSWGAPNQPGNASLDVTLPAGTTAVGCDLWTQQPYVSTIEVTATTADGGTHTSVVNTRARPAGSFVGLISDTSIVSVSFRPPKGQSGGRAITAPAFQISGDGIPLFGAFRPVWRSDGSRLSYRDGLCIVNTVPAQPKPGELVFDKLFAGEQPPGACAWDWGPNPALSDQIIYSANSDGEGSSIHRVREGGAHPGTKLHAFSELDLQLVSDLRWLPDGSGFPYSFPDLAYEFGNIHRYDFATKRATQLTNFEGEYARAFDFSPDGAWVVFERAKKWDDDKEVDLWVMRSDGRDARLLVRGGLAPAWR